jgi:hypothetical protein
LANGTTARTGATNFGVTDGNVLQIGNMTDVPSPALPERGIVVRKTGDASITSISDGGRYSVFENQIYGGNEPGSAAYNVFAKSRGSLASPQAVQNGDLIGIFDYRGFSGTGYGNSARIMTRVEGPVTTTSVPVSFEFHTVGPGETSPFQRLKISSNGNVGINNTAPSAPLVVQGVTGTGALKLIAPSVAANDNWWMGFGHGTTSTDANDRARIGVDIFPGGPGRLFFTTGSPNAQTRAMFIDENQRVGIGTSAPLTTLHVNNSLAATNTVNANAQVFRMMRPRADAVKSENIAQFNLGSYAVTSGNTHATSRLDLAMNDGDGPNTSNVMTWQANGNVGIRNTAPTATLDVNSSRIATNTINADATVLKLARPLNDGLKFPNIALFNLGSHTIGGQANTRLDLSLSNVNDTDIQNVMTWQANGNVGIGTTAPTSRLEVNGAATNTTSFNAGAGTTIDFSRSNLAYTTASPGAFTLSNLKDGGTYTLAVQGKAVGTASFTASGFTFKSPNNGPTTNLRETIYTFIVMGTSVYVYMTAGIVNL